MEHPLVEMYRRAAGSDDPDDLLEFAGLHGLAAMRDLAEALFSEKKADSIAVIVGPFEGPGRQATTFIRDLARRFDKVIVGVEAGRLDLRTKVELLRLSLPDFETKLEVQEVRGPTLGDALQQIAASGSAYKGETAVELYKCSDSSLQVPTGASVVDMSVVKVLRGPTSSDPKVLKAVQDRDPDALGRLMDPHAQSDPAKLQSLIGPAQQTEDAEHGGHEDDAGLQRALSTIPPETMDQRISGFGRWVKMQDHRAALAFYRISVSEDEPYLDIGSDHPLTCRIFVLPAEEFKAQTDRAGGEGFIVDAELYFQDVDGSEPWLWHNEQRAASREEAADRVRKIQRFIDSQTIRQLAGSRKSGPLKMTKLSEADAPTAVSDPDEKRRGEDRLIAIHAVKANEERLARRGLRVGRALGQGMKGVAFDCGDGRVLKVTTDASEAKSSFRLVGKNLQGVVRYDEVFQFPGPHKFLYGIVQEKLQPLDPKEKAFVNYGFEKIHFGLREQGGGFPFMNLSWEDIREFAAAKGDPNITRAVQIFEKLRINEILAELRKNGVKWADVHGGNLMRRGDRVVAIDLGVSVSPGGGAIPVLESFLREFFVDVAPSKAEGVRLIKDLVRNTEEALSGRGVDTDGMEWLGAGRNGGAWRLDDGRVLKVTTDDREAQMAARLVGRKFERLYVVYDVFAFPGEFNGHRIYGIVQEEGLEKPSDREREEFDELFQGDLTPARREKLSRKFDVQGMVDDLGEAGIPHADFHGGNILKRGSRFVLIDLGTPGDPGTAVNESTDQSPGEYAGVHFSRRPDAPTVPEPWSPTSGFGTGSTPRGLYYWPPDAKKMTHTADQASYVHAFDIYFKPGSRVLRLDRYQEADWAHDRPLLVGKFGEELVARAERLYDKYKERLYGPDRPGKKMYYVTSKLDHDVEDIDWSTSSAPRSSVKNFKALGYDAVEDRYGYIYSSEPVQGFFTHSDAYIAQPKTETKIKEDIEGTSRGDLDSFGGPEAVKDLLATKAQALANQKGVRVSSLRPLGRGEKGVAFDMGGGKVLKVSLDGDEAAAAWRLRGKANRHINRFHDVFRIQRSPVEVFGIVEDLLQPMSDQEKREFDDALANVMDDEIINSLATRDWDATWASIRSQVEQDVRQEMKIGADSGQGLVARMQRVIQKRLQELEATLTKYQVPEMVGELRKANVQFADFHGDNVLKRGADYVLNDLSRAKTDPANIEDLAEWMETSPRIASTSAWSSGMMAAGRDGPTVERPEDDDREQTGPARSVDFMVR